MEAKFEVKSTYNEEMFYHQLLASEVREPVVGEKKKPAFKLNLTFQDVLAFAAMIVVFYTVYAGKEGMDRIVQTVVTSLLAWIVYHFFIMKKSGSAAAPVKVSASGHDEALLNRARALLDNSCLKGGRCTVSFYDDGFQVENPEITTWYKYEGIAWIKETSKYFVIFWNKSLAIPVEKAGLYRGRNGNFAGFLEKACGKTIERVWNPTNK